MTDKATYAKAHEVINALLAIEPGRENANVLEHWEKSVRNRLRSEHWQTIIAELETGASVEALVSTLTPKPTGCPSCKPSGPVPVPSYSADEWSPATPADRERAKAKIAAIKETLTS